MVNFIQMRRGGRNMSKRGENIYKRSDGRWEGRYVQSIDLITGKKKYHSVYGKSYSEAKKKLLKARQEITETNLSCTIKEDYKLEHWLQIWLYQYAKLNVKEATFSNYYYYIHNHIIPKLGHKSLKKITTYDLQLFFNEKLLNGRLDGTGGLSPKSVKDLRTVLSTSFKQALYNNLINKNPCVNIKIPTDKYTNIRVLTVNEQKLLENSIKNSDHYLSLPIILALYSGLRLGEVCALQWKDIDLTNGIIRVTSNLQRIQVVPDDGETKTKMIISTPKSSASVREIPLPTRMIIYWAKKRKNI